MISVVMGVYNNQNTVKKAIESIFNGSFKDVEVIVCNDASSDNSLNVLKELAKSHPNLVILENTTNKGLAYSLNKCIKASKGEYIARADGDDYSALDRLAKQYDYLINHPEIDFVGTSAFLFNHKGNVYAKRSYPSNVDTKLVVKYNPFIHPTILIKKEVLEKVNYYDDSNNLLRVEDYDLFFRLYYNGYKGYNLPEELYYFYEDLEVENKHSKQSRKNEYYVRKKWNKLLKVKFPLSLYKYKPVILRFIPKGLFKVFHKKYSSNV